MTRRKSDPPIKWIVAAARFVDDMAPQADLSDGGAPLWFGWALREAYWQGRLDERAEWKRKRK